MQALAFDEVSRSGKVNEQARDDVRAETWAEGLTAKAGAGGKQRGKRQVRSRSWRAYR